MKIIYYKRTLRSTFHIHAGEVARCFFVPTEKIVVYLAQHGSFGGTSVSFTTEPRMLDEAEALAAGKLFDVENVEFSAVKELEVDNYAIQSLLDDARAKIVLEERVRQSVDKLKEMTGD